MSFLLHVEFFRMPSRWLKFATPVIIIGGWIWYRQRMVGGVLSSSLKPMRDEVMTSTTYTTTTTTSITNTTTTFLNSILRTDTADVVFSDNQQPNRTIQQLKEDQANIAFVPSSTGDVENWPFGQLVLGKLIYRGYESSVYRVANHQGLLIKYQADCEESTIELHPLIAEWWNGKEAFEAGVSPELLFLSPPIPFTSSLSFERRFVIPKKHLDSCLANSATLRFLVMKEIEGAKDLFAYAALFPGYVVPFNYAMTIGKLVVEKFKVLHTILVHGDVHPGNILVSLNGTEIERVWIIDFGRSRPNEPADPKPIVQPFHYFHPALSPWQILGYEWAARDDVYNFIRALALVMNGPPYAHHESRLMKGGRANVMGWKQYGYIFTIPIRLGEMMSSRTPFEFLPRERRVTARNALWRIVSKVRSLEQVNAIPPYDEIQNEFEICEQLCCD